MPDRLRFSPPCAQAFAMRISRSYPCRRYETSTSLDNAVRLLSGAKPSACCVMSYVLYPAVFAGAVGLVMMTPRSGYNPRLWGALLAAMALGGAWLWLASQWSADSTGLPGGARPYYYIFSALAILSAVRVITHTRPVYAALWFIMVVLASSGLFLVLDAAFMAFAMVIIYGGAILVTYVFVIMLAAQAGDEDDGEASPVYDCEAREPILGVAAGSILLAMLLSFAFPAQPFTRNANAADPADATIIQNVLTRRAAHRLATRLDAQANPVVIAAVNEQANTLTNTERVGLDLFRAHPLGLELAGVILLVALVGAVVIARLHVQDEKGLGTKT